jgi:class 3 adenylate cyclase/ribosomal protein L40E
MRCLACGHENPDDAKFCGECGSKLEGLCPGCGTGNPPTNKFCHQCGQALSVSSPLPDVAEPSPAVPTDAGERRQATIVFSDLSGYTAMNERLDPEEVGALMGRIKAEAVRIVEGHGGMVNQFVGDEVLALFGIPTAHEDDPLRAVRAALDLHAMVRQLSPEVETRLGQPLRMHTGIHTGLIVTNRRDDRDGRYGIIGDTVNIGARLKAQAEADAIVVSAESQRLIAPFFETQGLDALPMKGKAAPMRPYRVMAASQIHTRFEASARLHAVHRARTGSGHAAGLSGASPCRARPVGYCDRSRGGWQEPFAV